MVNVSNVIELPKNHKWLTYCNNELVLPNPEFAKKVRLNLWLGNTPQDISLYRVNQDKLYVPHGLLGDVLSRLVDEKVSYDYNDHKIEIRGNLELYDYQEKAVQQMINAKHGVLVSPAGSGKTQMAIEIIKRLSKKTLWVTHTKDLLKQSMSRFKQYFHCHIGVISEGKIEIGDVTFATVQTLSKSSYDYSNDFSVVIVDECHRVCSTPAKLTMFGKVINKIKAKHKYGLTATAHRSDGLIKSMFAYIGDVAHEVPKQTVAGKTTKAKVIKINTGYEMPRDSDCIDTDGTLIFSKFLSELSEDEERNKLIAKMINKTKGNSILVLSNRLEQLKHLQTLTGGVMIDGKTKKDNREQAIEAMRTGKEKILYASYNLAKEGLDIPRLDRLVMASPVKDYAVVVQSVGRIERQFDEKDEPIVYDFVDNMGITYNMWRNRKTIYNKNNNKIIGG